jgi:hypothetical protein
MRSPSKPYVEQRRTPVAADDYDGTDCDPPGFTNTQTCRPLCGGQQEIGWSRPWSFQRVFFRGPSVSMPLMTESTALCRLCVDKPKISFRAIADALRRGYYVKPLHSVGVRILW